MPRLAPAPPRPETTPPGASPFQGLGSDIPAGMLQRLKNVVNQRQSRVAGDAMLAGATPLHESTNSRGEMRAAPARGRLRRTEKRGGCGRRGEQQGVSFQARRVDEQERGLEGHGSHGNAIGDQVADSGTCNGRETAERSSDRAREQQANEVGSGPLGEASGAQGGTSNVTASRCDVRAVRQRARL